MPFYILISVLIFAPLAYGTTGPISMMLVQTVVFVGLLWVVIEAVLDRRKLYRPPGVLPLSLFGGLMLLQMIPLPSGLLKIISPTTWQHYTDTIWQLQPDIWMPLSFNPQRTLTAFFYFSTCLALYFLAVQCLSDSRRFQITVRLVAAFAGLYALVSIMESLLPNGRILWLLRPWPEYAGEQFGSYINGNHFAGLMGMLLPLTFAMFMVDKPVTHYGSLKDRLIDFCSDPRLGVHLLSGFAALLTAAAIFLSLSRGGILSTLGAMLVLGLLLAWRRHYRRQALILIGFIAVLFFFVGLFGWSAIFATFAEIRNMQGDIADWRLIYWRDCLALFRDFPIFGTGLGSFIDSYPAYQSLFQGELVVDHAHNDYVELCAEAGLAGLLLAGWASWAVVKESWQAFGRRRTPFAISIYLGSLAGICTLLLHSLTDFNLHIGANGLYFAFLAALLVSSATTSSRHSSELAKATRRGTRVAVPVLLVGLFGSLLFNVNEALVAPGILSPYVGTDLVQMSTKERDEALQTIRRAVSRAPLNANYRITEAQILTVSGLENEALQAYSHALQLRPLNPEILEASAQSAGRLGNLQLEESLLRASLELNQTDLRRYKVYVVWLLGQQRRDEAFALIRRGLALAPEQTTYFVTKMAIHGIDWPEMKLALPDRTRAWLLYADYLIKVGRERLAEHAYRRAVGLVAHEPQPSPHPYKVFSRFLQREQRYEEALSLMLDSLKLFPSDADLHAVVGTLFEQQGLELRASESYRQALMINPRLKWVRQRLARLE